MRAQLENHSQLHNPQTSKLSAEQDWDDPPLGEAEDRHGDRHAQTIAGGPETAPSDKGDDPNAAYF